MSRSAPLRRCNWASSCAEHPPCSSSPAQAFLPVRRASPHALVRRACDVCHRERHTGLSEPAPATVSPSAARGVRAQHLDAPAVLVSHAGSARHAMVRSPQVDPLRARSMFGHAKMESTTPNVTHLALAALEAENLVNHVITQNVDCACGVRVHRGLPLTNRCPVSLAPKGG